jgi:hypothetical protein
MAVVWNATPASRDQRRSKSKEMDEKEETDQGLLCQQSTQIIIVLVILCDIYIFGAKTNICDVWTNTVCKRFHVTGIFCRHTS